MKELTNALILALISISTAVTIQLLNRNNAWGLIVVYWIVLAAKNAADYIVKRKDDEK